MHSDKRLWKAGIAVTPVDPPPSDRPTSNAAPRRTNWKALLALGVGAVMLIGVVWMSRGRPAAAVPEVDPRRVWNDADTAAEQLWQRGDYRRAERAAQEAVRLAEGGFPEQGFAMAKSLNQLGLILTALARYDDANDAFVRSLAINRQLFGEASEQVAIGGGNLGLSLMKQGNVKDAETLFRSSLDLLGKLAGPESAETVLAQSNLAVCLDAAERYDEALPLHEDVVKRRRQLFGVAHPQTAESMSNLAAAIIRSSDGDSAKRRRASELYRRAVAVQQRLLPPDSLPLANSLAGLSLLALDDNRLEEAESTCFAALAIRTSKLGRQHPSTALSLDTLGRIRERQGDVVEAEEMLREALVIREQRLGPGHLKTVESLEHLASFLRGQKRTAEAEALTEKALAAEKGSAEEPESKAEAKPAPQDRPAEKETSGPKTGG